MKQAFKRWQRTLTGFPGLGGLGWLSSVMLCHAALGEESVEPAEIAGSDTRYVTVNNEAVAYREMGTGELTIILLHGFGGRIETWRDVQPVLAKQHRTVAIDLWGFGASGRPTKLTQRDWITETFSLMDALDIGSAVFIGHSLGGRVSLLCARQAPERVRGMVLCDADWGQAPHGYLLAWLLTHSPLFPAAMRRLRGESAHVRRLMTMVLGRDFVLTPELIELFHAPLRVRGTARTLASVGRSNHLRNIGQLTRGITCPSLIVWGEDDPVIPSGYAALLAKRLGAGAPVLVPNCGHFPQEEYPNIVNNAILEFLSRIA